MRNTKTIDLRKIKLAIYDFDDTLAIHRDRDYVQHRKELGELTYFEKAYCNPENFYDEIDPCDVSENMLNLTAYLRLHNVKMFCLSGMRMSIHAQAKQEFINKHYGNDIQLVSASSQEGKVEVVQILQKVNGCSPDEVLFVDDLHKVIDLINSQGFNGILVTEVHNLRVGDSSLPEVMSD